MIMRFSAMTLSDSRVAAIYENTLVGVQIDYQKDLVSSSGAAEFANK